MDPVIRLSGPETELPRWLPIRLADGVYFVSSSKQLTYVFCQVEKGLSCVLYTEQYVTTAEREHSNTHSLVTFHESREQAV